MAFDPKDHIIQIVNKKTGKSKPYLQVAPRIVWFRSENPHGQILTDIVASEPVMMVKATIVNNEGHVLATGHGSATPKADAVWTGRELEKAETAAIGRALAACGYGTIDSLEFEDGEDDHLADSPVGKSTPRSNPPQQTEPAEKQTTVTSVTVKKSNNGKPYLQFTTSDNLTVSAWSRQWFIEGLWITENEWTQGTTQINPPIPVTIATDGKYWNITNVQPMSDPFADDDPLEAAFPRKGKTA